MYNTVSVMGSGTVRVDHNLVNIGNYILVPYFMIFNEILKKRRVILILPENDY